MIRIHTVYIAVASVIFMLGCDDDSCGGEMKMFGDQFLNEEISGQITHQDYPNTITFIDSTGNLHEFEKIVNKTILERVNPDYFGECDNGLSFAPFYNRERFELQYASLMRNDTISLTIDTRVSTLTTRESSLMPNDQRQRGRERIFVKLSFQDCPIVNTFRFLEDPGGVSVINSVPLTRRKFQQRYSDTYGISNAWSNEVWFSYSRGIVAFNYCGRNHAQVVD